MLGLKYPSVLGGLEMIRYVPSRYYLPTLTCNRALLVFWCDVRLIHIAPWLELIYPELFTFAEILIGLPEDVFAYSNVKVLRAFRSHVFVNGHAPPGFPGVPEDTIQVSGPSLYVMFGSGPNIDALLRSLVVDLIDVSQWHFQTTC